MLAVVGAGALVSIFFWNTATVVETPLHGRADLYVPPIPVEMAAAERREVIAERMTQFGQAGHAPDLEPKPLREMQALYV